MRFGLFALWRAKGSGSAPGIVGVPETNRGGARPRHRTKQKKSKARIARDTGFEHRRHPPPPAKKQAGSGSGRSCAASGLPMIRARRRGALLANYQPTVTVAIVGFSVCSDELKPPTSSYAKPYDSALMLWSCQNFEYEFDGLA